MSSINQATSTEAAALETAQPSWLPNLSGLSLGELTALDGMVLESSVDHLKHYVNRPLSTIGGSQGS
ncbi:hypothetical protein ABZ848_23330 [Streptomyces sp. NPDC047081]|uniref:hypothetical protein n=1 Tax=Streptomyces sp. NPDC047081 TaxID=3154706 RepID=UPI0033E9181A